LSIWIVILISIPAAVLAGPWTVATARCGRQPVLGNNFAAGGDHLLPGQRGYETFAF